MAATLLSLPLEILLLILKLLGASFFRDDVRRLAVCKRWFHFALEVFWTDVNITNIGMKRLMRSPDLTRQLERFKDNIRSLSIHILEYGCRRPGPFNTEDEYGDENKDKNAIAAAIIQDKSLLNSAEWEGRFEHDFSRLLDRVQEGGRLRSFRLTTPIGVTGEFRRRVVIYYPILLNVLALSRITFLELDMFQTLFKGKEELHICPLIPSLFSQLRCLHLRMRRVCPDVLQPGGDDENGCPISLEEVIIYLGVPSAEPSYYPMAKVRRSRLCWGYGKNTRPSRCHPEAEMFNQARLLAARMVNPKVFKLVIGGENRGRDCLQSLDVLSNQRVNLTKDVEWDAV